MNTTTGISPDILKACDIRGIVGSQLNEQDAWLTGRSFGTILRRKSLSTCVVGYDGRLTSESLTEALIRGLCESGIHVISLGLVPTPLVYFALHHLGADGGIIVTASHNPAEYNGFKFLTGKGPFHGEDLQEFAPLSRSRNFSEGEGSYRSLDLRKEYIAYLGSFLMPSDRKLSVVWDPGNGAAAAVLDDFLSILPGTHISICSEVDGRFPHHHPDPSLPENMEMLKAAVLEKGADLGIAFDGDGDRIGVVDGEGEIIPGDQLLVLYARDLLRRSPGAVIMSEVKASRFFYDDVRARGGIPLLWKVGHTHQKEKMALEDIPLAGETSGHIFFRENRGLDDALFAAVKLLNILTSTRESLADIRKKFPRFYDSGEIRLHLDAPERERVVNEIRERFDREGREYLALDGIRTEFPDGFWMLRGSNTQPHITIRCESSTPDGLELCLKDMTRQLELSGIETGK